MPFCSRWRGARRIYNICFKDLEKGEIFEDQILQWRGIFSFGSRLTDHFFYSNKIAENPFDPFKSIHHRPFIKRSASFLRKRMRNCLQSSWKTKSRNFFWIHSWKVQFFLKYGFWKLENPNSGMFQLIQGGEFHIWSTLLRPLIKIIFGIRLIMKAQNFKFGKSPFLNPGIEIGEDVIGHAKRKCSFEDFRYFSRISW